MRDFRTEALMRPRLDAVFSPATPVGTGIDIDTRIAEMDARCKVFQFRPLRNQDVIVVIGTFFFAVAKTESADFSILLELGRRLEAILAIQGIAGMEAQVAGLVEGHIGIAPDTAAVIAVVGRPRQQRE